MPIETMPGYHPKLVLPVYTKLIDPRHNQYEVGSKYDIRIEDPERQQEKGGKGPYNYAHEALLIAKHIHEDMKEIPDVLLAFDKNTKSRSDAKEELSHNDGEVALLVFLRLDMVKEVVENGPDNIDPASFGKEDVEGNGQDMD